MKTHRKQSPFKSHEDLIEAVETSGNMPTQVEGAAGSMFNSWANKIHDQLADAFPEMSMWAETSEEKAAVTALRKALAAVKRAL